MASFMYCDVAMISESALQQENTVSAFLLDLCIAWLQNINNCTCSPLNMLFDLIKNQFAGKY